jgi:hypothetical protein
VRTVTMSGMTSSRTRTIATNGTSLGENINIEAERLIPCEVTLIRLNESGFPPRKRFPACIHSRLNCFNFPSMCDNQLETSKVEFLK